MSKMTALYERSACPNPEYIRRQMTNLETYATNCGFQHCRHFTDDGFSANDRVRPGLVSLLAAVEAHQVQTLITLDSARLTRKMPVFFDLINHLKDNGVRIIVLNNKLDILPPHIHDDENGLDYTLNGDYYLPNIIDQSKEDHRPLGKWGMMRMDYLKEHRPGLYSSMLLSGKLHTHLADLEEQARDRHELVVRQMAETEGVNEHLKMNNQMEWVRRMNNISAAVDEIIMAEMIFS